MGRALGGLGIGIALVKQLVTLHDGRVDAKRPDVGWEAKLSIHLPLGTPLPEPPPWPSRNNPSPSIR